MKLTTEQQIKRTKKLIENAHTGFHKILMEFNRNFNKIWKLKKGDKKEDEK